MEKLRGAARMPSAFPGTRRGSAWDRSRTPDLWFPPRTTGPVKQGERLAHLAEVRAARRTHSVRER